MEFQDIDELSLPFIDEERIKLLPKPTLNHYPRLPDNQINFNNIFDLD